MQPNSKQQTNVLEATLKHLMAPGKGILAADESTKSAQKRFDALSIPFNEEARRQWRQLLISTPNSQDFLSGVIFYDETIRQRDDSGKSFPQLLIEQGVLPGIKVDAGLVDLNNFPQEQITEGLDGLDVRLKEYYRMGARFAKWRAAYTIGSKIPSEAAIHANGNVFGRYASLCQSNGIIPIIEPEVLYDGDHSLDECLEATSRVLSTSLDIVRAYRVDMRHIVVKTGMVLAGKRYRAQSTPEEVATATLYVLNKAISSEVGGVVFLSGGQAPVQATKNLNAIGARGKQPWPITFSFSRAVQDPVMEAWLGNKAHVAHAQRIFYHRLACNSAARAGEYSSAMELKKKV